MINYDYSKEWAEYVQKAHDHLKGTCPLQEDELIVWADEKIEQLEAELREEKDSYEAKVLRTLLAERNE